MHNLFLVYFVNLYMFRAYLGPSSGGTTLCIQQLVLIILFRWLFVVLVGLENMFRAYLGQSSGGTTMCIQQLVLIILFRWLFVVLVGLENSNPTRTTNSHLKRIISTNCCIHMVVPPDDGPRYARNM